MKTPTSPPIVAVMWEDAKAVDSDSIWVENKDHNYEPHIFWQVGFLLSSTDEGIILAAAWNPEQVAPRDQIPRGMIRSITYLEPVKAKKKAK